MSNASQKWTSLGHIFCDDKHSDILYSHASYPVVSPIPNDDGSLAVYYSPRDINNKSHIARLDITLDGDDVKVKKIYDEPVLSPGPRGAFDDAGVTIGSIPFEGAGNIRLYYLGWTIPTSVPFTNFIGMAELNKNTTQATRISPAPIIGRSKTDPYSLGYPWVIKKDHTHYECWYGSHRFWGDQGLEMEHVIHHAHSTDGVHWSHDANAVAIDIKGGDEFAVSRPSVFITPDGTHHMLYARRFDSYKPGYAHSHDGRTWVRDDERFTLENTSDWDSDAVTYMSLFSHQGNIYMLYNGNGYGKTGFGIARLKDNKF